MMSGGSCAWVSRRPVIGITPRQEARSCGEQALFAQRAVVDAVIAVGGIPVVLGAPCDTATLGQVVESFDGFVVPGGSDIEPARYGHEPHAACGPTSFLRDELELALIPRVVAANKPLLGICRGCQAINVALGGTLWQDLPTQPEAHARAATPVAHRQQEPYSAPVHAVAIAAGSRLSSALGLGEKGGELAVNSLHHQSVRKVAPGLTVNAWSCDGVVEGVELPGAAFVVGVQWHPEFLWQEEPHNRALFEALVRAAQVRARGC